MVTSNEYKNDQKIKKTFYITAAIFAFVVVLNVGLYFYNSYLTGVNEDLSSNLAAVESNINTINQDPAIKLYTLINANKNYLDKYVHLSNIPEFINNLKDLSKNYSVKFQWFAYADGKVSSYATTSDDEVSLGSTKAKKFVEYFRKKDDNIFKLWFINSFEWQTEVRFNVDFQVK